MGDELAGANVGRAYALTGTSIAIFTFVLFFLYPRFTAGEINSVLFQVTLLVMGVATFSFVFSSFYYYCAAAGRFEEAERATFARRGDRFWLLGYSLLFFDPSLILYTIGLQFVAIAWFALWLVYMIFLLRYFPRLQGLQRG